MSFLTFLTDLVCQLSCCYTTLRQDPCPGRPPLEPGARSLRHPKVREGGEDQAGKLLFRAKLPHKKNIEIWIIFQNLDLFSFELTEEDMARIAAEADKGHRSVFSFLKKIIKKWEMKLFVYCSDSTTRATSARRPSTPSAPFSTNFFYRKKTSWNNTTQP